MATQNPLLPIGQWVQYNATTQNPAAPGPDAAECTVGIVRGSYTKSDGPYYQVVWNPGSVKPQTGLYHANQLTALTQDQVNSITSQLAQGQMPTSNSGTLGSNYQQPYIPTTALPPDVQELGVSVQPTGKGDYNIYAGT